MLQDAELIAQLLSSFAREVHFEQWTGRGASSLRGSQKGPEAKLLPALFREVIGSGCSRAIPVPHPATVRLQSTPPHRRALPSTGD